MCELWFDGPTHAQSARGNAAYVSIPPRCRCTEGARTASHFIEFSGVTPPNSRMVTVESAELLNLFESEAVPQNTLLCALNALSRPVAAGAGEPVDVAGGVVVGAGAAPGWH